MYGAILGDIIGSPYEFDESNIKTKEFPLFGSESRFTDDTVMTLAVAEALMDAEDKGFSAPVQAPVPGTGEIEPDPGAGFRGPQPGAGESGTASRTRTPADQRRGPEDPAWQATARELLVKSMQTLGRRYPDVGYGANFKKWIWRDPRPYGSFGNGSAMRVSAAAWLFDDLAAAREAARTTAVVTHDHPEGLKGAEAVASAIFLGRTGRTKDEIRDYIVCEFSYDLSRTCDEIRPGYRHVETCQETVPEAITAFLEGQDFEDVIRNAVSLGGDCDTLTAIAGSMAEGFYGVPEPLKNECRSRLPDDLRAILDRFDKRMARE